MSGYRIIADTSSLLMAEIDGWAGVTNWQDAKALNNGVKGWLGALGVTTGLWRAMGQARASACVVIWDTVNGLAMTPDVIGPATEAMNRIGQTDEITPERLRQALTGALQLSFGPGGGVLIMWREPLELKLNAAAYDEGVLITPAELMREMAL